MSRNRERRRLTDRQLAGLQRLLGKVPTQARYDWNSEQGKAFICEASRLIHEGVPISWIAEAVNLPPGALYNLLHRTKGTRENDPTTPQATA